MAGGRAGVGAGGGEILRFAARLVGAPACVPMMANSKM